MVEICIGFGGYYVEIFYMESLNLFLKFTAWTQSHHSSSPASNACLQSKTLEKLSSGMQKRFLFKWPWTLNNL